MIRFYSPDIADSLKLPEGESGHCCRVLRLKEGADINVVDGKGFSYECRLTNANPKGAEVEILSSKAEEKYWKGRIVMAVAVTKNIDRIEWLLEKAVEIGVDEIALLVCDRSERRKVNEERMEKILVSAMKQSLKATLPEYHGLEKLSAFLSRCDTMYKYMGYCDEKTERRELAKEYPGNADVTILIGPEGDFSPEEVERAFKAGFMPVTFGNTRLRTETAALYGLTALHVINNATS